MGVVLAAGQESRRGTHWGGYGRPGRMREHVHVRRAPCFGWFRLPCTFQTVIAALNPLPITRFLANPHQSLSPSALAPPPVPERDQVPLDPGGGEAAGGAAQEVWRGGGRGLGGHASRRFTPDVRLRFACPPLRSASHRHSRILIFQHLSTHPSLPDLRPHHPADSNPPPGTATAGLRSRA